MLINNSGASHYSFNSVSTHTSMINGKRQSTTEAVSVRNGKGMKTVVKRVGAKKTRSKKSLSTSEVKNIMDRKFMPDLFTPCHDECAVKLISSKAKARQTKKRAKRGSK
jgi:hypothetical protein